MAAASPPCSRSWRGRSRRIAAVTIPKGAQIGFVRQELVGTDLEKQLEDFVLEVLPSWTEFWHEWRAALDAGDDAALLRLARRQEELEHQYGYNPEHRAQAILGGLGFPCPRFRVQWAN